ncbi:App1 family protein [Corynebacterium timonense]|uniref:Phosphatidate phosphatase APP1 n=1 Tax=Corynebacterium timonense TaxID=441500 RepID=A0A1H1U0D1_9CORY|nr:phosphatase domain-containing protein [Corynebacterium timonense]SDS65696.1 Phosphatidate phosphatase APP1 [Corynebacterium timonense]
MAIADAARWVEARVRRAGVRAKARKAWIPAATGFTGYGTPGRARVLGRVLMADPAADASAARPQRGYRQFLTTPVPDMPVTVRLGARTVRTRTDDQGYVVALVEGHGLEPGWHTALLDAPLSAHPAPAPVRIIADDVTHGVISDIDDTIMVTNLPRALLAAWNSWVLRATNRRPVDGMARFLHAAHGPGEPVFYVSTGAWNTYGMLHDFMQRHGFPAGPMLLTDWGPTPTALFRSGPEHKRVQLRNLLIDFPGITWTLVGDDGQHDPMIYSGLVAEHPGRVKLVALRELTAPQHLLAHGTATTMEQPGDYRGVPAIYGADGDELLEQLRRAGG